MITIEIPDTVIENYRRVIAQFKNTSTKRHWIFWKKKRFDKEFLPEDISLNEVVTVINILDGWKTYIKDDKIFQEVPTSYDEISNV